MDKFDFEVYQNGTIDTMICRTDAATNWVSRNCAIESWQGDEHQFCADPRCLMEIANAMVADGLRGCLAS